MRALLDSHTLLWWSTGFPALSERARDFLRESEEVYLSLASCWELVIKAQLGKLHFPGTPELFFRRVIEERQLRLLPIELRHLLRVFHLPLHHKDPFDRLLVAQAQEEGLALVTGDSEIRRYEVEVVW